MFSHHLNGLLNRTVAAVLAHLEWTITPSALRDPSDVKFKGISIYRADPTGTTGLATSSHRQRRRDPAAARNGATRVAMP